ncbi:MAG: alpha/beta hydrolase [Oscillospiraceae bacterium]|nr:alpha/beta hydrolase [Oscillospiraceae bacterium]
MAKFSEFTFPSSDGVHDIVCSLWLPEQGSPKAVVQIVHGIAEYVNRYDHFARFLADNGFAVCGDDHLGHGRTAMQDSKFGYFAPHDGWVLATADERLLRQRMGAQYPGIPYFLLGHSMGSFLTRTYLCRYPGEVSGAILSGTGQEPALTVAAGKLLANTIANIKGPEYVSRLIHSLSLGAYNKQFAPNRTTADWISRDEAVVDAYMADPLCQFIPTVSLYRDMLGGLQYISSERALSQMDPNTPVYLYSGDKDPVGSSGAGVKKVYGFFRSHGTKDLTLKLYADGRHEMHNELNRDEVYADVLAWLDKHI